MKAYIITALFLGSASLPIVHAESDLYVSGGLSSFDLPGAEPSAVTVRGGWLWNEHFGAELEGSFGIGSDEVGASGLQLDIESQVAAYVVGRVPLGDWVSLFGRIGYARTELELEFLEAARIEQTDGIAFGAGGEIMLTDRFGLRGEYTRMSTDDDTGYDEIDVLSLSGVIKFGGTK